MASIHGKNAVLYLGVAGAAATLVNEQLEWSLDFDMQTVDVSPLNNTWKTFVKGMLGFSLSAGGNFDTANKQLWLASISTVAEKFYLYPQASVPTSYYYGTIWVQLGKIVAGSTTTKASNSIKGVGTGVLDLNG